MASKKNSSEIFVKIDKRILTYKWRHFPFPPRTEDCFCRWSLTSGQRREEQRGTGQGREKCSDPNETWAEQGRAVQLESSQ